MLGLNKTKYTLLSILKTLNHHTTVYHTPHTDKPGNAENERGFGRRELVVMDGRAASPETGRNPAVTGAFGSESSLKSEACA